jgi:hypothetical protein
MCDPTCDVRGACDVPRASDVLCAAPFAGARPLRGDPRDIAAEATIEVRGIFIVRVEEFAV